MARARRLIWVVNHRTLLPAEIPIFRDLGYEVLIPKVIPDDPGMRSLVVTDEYDTTLSVPADVLDLLNRHNFYEGEWSPRLTSLLNEHFDVIVCTVSPYIAALAESARKFEGTLVARVFGREDPRTYTEFFALPEVADVLPALEGMGDRFVFGQGFDYLAAVETTQLSRRAHTITVPLPRSTYDYADTWRGDGDQLVLLCPEIVASPTTARSTTASSGTSATCRT
jgi:hypothetical protein